MNRTFGRWAAIGVAALVVGGCSGDGDGNGPLTPGGGTTLATQLTGVFLSGSGEGLLNVTIDSGILAPRLRAPGLPDTAVAASAVMNPVGGGVINLTGTYDPVVDTLHLSGQGVTVRAVIRSHVAPALLGTFTGPNGTGSVLGVVGTTSNVAALCGEFQSTPYPLSGLWNFVVTGGALSGLAAFDGEDTVMLLSGTVVGTGVARDVTFSAVVEGYEFQGTWNTSTDHVSGTWLGVANEGTWSGERCLPGTTGQEGVSRPSATTVGP